jgi:Secretion system C-terminal sorting domain
MNYVKENNASKGLKPYIRNLLMAIDTLSYQEPYIFPDILKATTMQEQYDKLLNSPGPVFLKLQPNPAKDYVVLEYKLEKEGDASISISNLIGHQKLSLKLSGMEDRKIIDTHNWDSGIYIATLQVNGQRIESLKFSIVK